MSSDKVSKPHAWLLPQDPPFLHHEAKVPRPSIRPHHAPQEGARAHRRARTAPPSRQRQVPFPPLSCRIFSREQVTQCLAAADSNEWYLAVAKPSAHGPRVEDLAVFQVPVSRDKHRSSQEVDSPPPARQDLPVPHVMGGVRAVCCPRRSRAWPSNWTWARGTPDRTLRTWLRWGSSTWRRAPVRRRVPALRTSVGPVLWCE